MADDPEGLLELEEALFGARDKGERQQDDDDEPHGMSCSYVCRYVFHVSCTDERCIDVWMDGYMYVYVMYACMDDHG